MCGSAGRGGSGGSVVTAKVGGLRGCQRYTALTGDSGPALGRLK